MIHKRAQYVHRNDVLALPHTHFLKNDVFIILNLRNRKPLMLNALLLHEGGGYVPYNNYILSCNIKKLWMPVDVAYTLKKVFSFSI